MLEPRQLNFLNSWFLLWFLNKTYSIFCLFQHLKSFLLSAPYHHIYCKYYVPMMHLSWANTVWESLNNSNTPHMIQPVLQFHWSKATLSQNLCIHGHMLFYIQIYLLLFCNFYFQVHWASIFWRPKFTVFTIKCFGFFCPQKVINILGEIRSRTCINWFFFLITLGSGNKLWTQNGHTIF